MFRNKEGNVAVGKIIAVVIVIILVVSATLGSFVVIPAGHTGVTVTFGKVSEQVLQEGIHFKVPFAQEIVQIDNRIVKLEVSTEAFSKDLQTVSTVLAVNYRIAKNMSYSIYKEVGAAFEEVLVTPAVNEVLKSVTANYTAQELVSSREGVSTMLNTELAEKLSGYGIFIDDLNIINWDFSAEYISAVEAKQVAEQNLIKTRTEQEQAVVIANHRCRGGGPGDQDSLRGQGREQQALDRVPLRPAHPLSDPGKVERRTAQGHRRLHAPDRCGTGRMR